MKLKYCIETICRTAFSPVCRSVWNRRDTLLHVCVSSSLLRSTQIIIIPGHFNPDVLAVFVTLPLVLYAGRASKMLAFFSDVFEYLSPKL